MPINRLLRTASFCFRSPFSLPCVTLSTAALSAATLPTATEIGLVLCNRRVDIAWGDAVLFADFTYGHRAILNDKSFLSERVDDLVGRKADRLRESVKTEFLGVRRGCPRSLPLPIRLDLRVDVHHCTERWNVEESPGNDKNDKQRRDDNLFLESRRMNCLGWE